MKVATKFWHVWLLLGLFAWVGHAQAESSANRASTGFSYGVEGAKAMNPQGSGLGIRFDGRFLSSEVSVLGNGAKTPLADGAIPRILAPVQADLSRTSGFSNPDLFFKNIGKTEQNPVYRRPTTTK